MAEENNTPAASENQDTRTRKTVRLRTVGAAPQSQDKPISDPLTTRDTDTGNLEILDHTQTRRTLKLKPMAPGAGALPKLNIASSVDTNTRKTVVLRPVNPGAAAAPGAHLKPQAAAPKADAAEPPATEDAEDKTAAVPRPTAARSTLKLNLGGTSPVPGAAKAAEAAPDAAHRAFTVPGKSDDADDQTTAVPRPAVAKATVPPIEAAQSDAAPEAAESEDQTVKLKRPPKLTPPTPPRITPPKAAAAAAETGSAGNDDVKATVKLAFKPPTAKPPAMPPKPPTAAPKPPVMPPKPPTAAAAAAAPAAGPSADAEISLAPSKKEKVETADGEKGEGATKARRPFEAAKEENPPSAFYLVVAVATLLLVIGAGVISAVHYLDFEHGLKYYDKVPGLPMAK